MFVKSLRIVLGLLLAALIIGGPFAYASRSLKQIRNFKVLAPGKVYRSGQASPAMLKKIIEDYGIRTVISLRDARPGQPTEQYDAEETYVKSQGLRYLKLTPKSWASVEGKLPEVQPNVDQFLQAMDEAKNYPVWIHCFAGTHRTGMYCAIYRMEYEHWTNEAAMEELQSLGYVKLAEENVSDYLRSYVPRWKR